MNCRSTPTPGQVAWGHQFELPADLRWRDDFWGEGELGERQQLARLRLQPLEPFGGIARMGGDHGDCAHGHAGEHEGAAVGGAGSQRQARYEDVGVGVGGCLRELDHASKGGGRLQRHLTQRGFVFRPDFPRLKVE